ncbi:acyl carrier protein [Enterobacter cancerogenus]|uniref:acyl carrier protein n=1 Tax=Enterobacter cancerogenus TaxID=69218 RepID=UPI0037F74EF6
MKSKDIVLTCLSRALKTDAGSIPLNASLETQLNIDSTEIIGVLVDLEKALSIKLDDTCFSQLSDVSSLIALVDSKLD